MQDLVNFLNNKIKKLSLVFKWISNCGQLKNTIILCQTDKGKVIGGYSPLAFNLASISFDGKKDESGESFTFSLKIMINLNTIKINIIEVILRKKH